MSEFDRLTIDDIDRLEREGGTYPLAQICIKLLGEVKALRLVARAQEAEAANLAATCAGLRAALEAQERFADHRRTCPRCNDGENVPCDAGYALQDAATELRSAALAPGAGERAAEVLRTGAAWEAAKREERAAQDNVGNPDAPMTWHRTRSSAQRAEKEHLEAVRAWRGAEGKQ